MCVRLCVWGGGGGGGGGGGTSGKFYCDTPKILHYLMSNFGTS